MTLPNAPSPHVYFIKPIGQRGPIKIGCTRFIGARLDTLAHWSPTPLEVVAAVPGNFKIERHLHKRFAADRLHKEWFSWSQELSDGIGMLVAGASIEDAFSIERRTRTVWGKVVPLYVKAAQ